MAAMNRDNWVETTAKVYSCGWEGTPERAFIFRAPGDLSSGQYLVVFGYEADGNHCSGEFKSSKEWKEGSTFPLKYNPEKPDENDRADQNDGPLATILSWLAGAALVALYFWWKSRK